MFKWFFTALIICIVAAERTTFTFEPQEIILAKCIKHHLANIDSRYEYAPVVDDLAYLAARRYHGKSIPCDLFNERFKQFLYQLRKKLSHNISKDQLSKELIEALKQALIICGDYNPVAALGKETVQVNEWISFSTDKDFLFDCVKSHLKLTGHWEFEIKDGFIEFLANCAVKRFQGRSLSRRVFNKNSRMLFYNLRKRKVSHNVSIDRLSYELELSATQAIEDCAIDKTPLAAVPLFDNEPIGIAHLLNLILVNWPYELHHMVRSRIGRSLLRRYTKDAWTSLIHELNNFHNDTGTFRSALRFFWKIRAQILYDAYSESMNYIIHRYTFDYPTPHMSLSNFDELISRSNKSFSDRNPPVPRSYLNRILNIHKADRTVRDDEVDIFDYYDKIGMTYAELYLEYQINQFYRIIFFFLEVFSRGICTDENDVFDGSLPNNFISEQFQAIIYDDDAYRDYLLDERYFYKLLMGNNIQNEIAQTLFGSARVLEENLILLRANIASTSGIQSISEIVTTVNPTTTTTKSLKRKDDVWKNKNGKCFPRKQAKTASYSTSNYSTHNLSTLDQITSSSFQDHNFSDDLFRTNLEFDASQDKIDKIVYGYLMFSDDDLKDD